ncbi:MAG: hypothetical protein WEB00_05260 [Dehalococcoidia bacterium]
MRPYQADVVNAVLDSVLAGDGRSFSVMISSRQGGKNALSAQLELLLLILYSGRGGSMVKTAPTLDPQLRVSRERVLKRLKVSGAGRLLQVSGDTLLVGNASLTFLSGQPGASVVGHTASLLLEVDEAQHMRAESFERDFRPMTMATGATVVFYGTAWDPDSLLETVKAHHLALEAEDGVRRHFEFDHEAVARDFPAYGQRVEEQRRLLGARSPIFLSQYCLLAQKALGRLFTSEQIESLRGAHCEWPATNLLAEQAGRPPGTYVAGLDVGGHKPGKGRDPTVLTVARVEPSASGGAPRVEIVKHRQWQAGWDRIQPELVAAARLYGLRRICIDATGVGDDPAAQLGAVLGSSVVELVSFTVRGKSDLGFGLLEAVEGGRLSMYREDRALSRQFWQQIEHAQADYRDAGTISFSVPERLGHDDYLVSLALCLRAAGAARPRVAQGFSRG